MPTNVSPARQMVWPATSLCVGWLKPKDPANLSSCIARHEEQYEQLQRRHHSVLRAYLHSVAAGLRPSLGQARGPSILKCSMACAAHAAKDGCPMDPSTPHERQPEIQSMHALACFPSGINVLVQLAIRLLLSITNFLLSSSPSVRLTRCGTAGDACQGSSV